MGITATARARNATIKARLTPDIFTQAQTMRFFVCIPSAAIP